MKVEPGFVVKYLLCLVFVFETGPCCVAQAVLEHSLSIQRLQADASTPGLKLALLKVVQLSCPWLVRENESCGRIIDR